MVNGIWTIEKNMRKAVQGSLKQILEHVDEKNTIKVMEIGKGLEQMVSSTIVLKVDEQ